MSTSLALCLFLFYVFMKPGVLSDKTTEHIAPQAMLGGASLSPAQQCAAEGLLDGIPAGDVLVLRSESGMGRTTILRKVHAAMGGGFAGIRQFMGMLMARQPAAIEEAFLELIDELVAAHSLVIIDDLHLIVSVVESCEYPRSCLLDAALAAILAEASARKTKLIFGVDEGDAPLPVRRRAYSWEVREFTAEDYEFLCRAHLDAESANRLDYARIHRFAPMLNAHQLKNACVWLGREIGVDTDRFIEYLGSQNLTSNV